MSMFRKLLHLLCSALLFSAAAPHASHAQQASATVPVSVRFVDPGGIGEAQRMGLPRQAPPRKGSLVVTGDAAEYRLTGAADQTVSVEASRRVALQAPQAGGTEGAPTAELRSARMGEQLRITPEARIAAGTAGGLYTGAAVVLAHFN